LNKKNIEAKKYSKFEKFISGIKTKKDTLSAKKYRHQSKETGANQDEKS
jgi:hypothetical protein